MSRVKVKKTLKKLLKYFEEDPYLERGGKVVYYYYPKEGHEVFCGMDEVVQIVKLADGNWAVDTGDRGRLESTEDGIADLDVYEMKQVY